MIPLHSQYFFLSLLPLLIPFLYSTGLLFILLIGALLLYIKVVYIHIHNLVNFILQSLPSSPPSPSSTVLPSIFVTPSFHKNFFFLSSSCVYKKEGLAVCLVCDLNPELHTMTSSEMCFCGAVSDQDRGWHLSCTQHGLR